MSTFFFQDFNGGVVQIGAQLEHGTEGNAVFEIASEQGFLDDPDSPSLLDAFEHYYFENRWEMFVGLTYIVVITMHIYTCVTQMGL
jgi:hypothetical protein